MSRELGRTTLPTPLGECPVKNGFRLRGHEMTRIETFTDAAFAFAVTLLVISVDAVPTSFEELTDALLDVPAFLASFALMMMFWSGHWRWSRRFGLEDVPTILLSCALVFIVLCYVYPMKFLSMLFMYWVSAGELSSNVSLEGIDQLYDIFAIYSAGFVAMSTTILLLNLHAWRLREALELSPLERFDTLVEIGAWVILIAVGSASVALALLTPPSWFCLPGWIYWLLAFSMPVFSVVTDRRRRKLVDAAR